MKSRLVIFLAFIFIGIYGQSYEDVEFKIVTNDNKEHYVEVFNITNEKIWYWDSNGDKSFFLKSDVLEFNPSNSNNINKRLTVDNPPIKQSLKSTNVNDKKFQSVFFRIGLDINTLIKSPNFSNYNASSVTSNFYTINANVSLGIHITNGFYIMPEISLGMLNTYIAYSNKKGTFMPEGYTKKIPYSRVGEGWSLNHYSSEYLYNNSDAEARENQFGGSVLKKIGKNFSLSLGYYYVMQIINIYDYTAIDEYMWAYSQDTKYDVYNYQTNSEFKKDEPTKYTLNSSLINLAFNLDVKYYGISTYSNISNSRFSLGFKIYFKI